MRWKMESTQRGQTFPNSRMTLDTFSEIFDQIQVCHLHESIPSNIITERRGAIPDARKLRLQIATGCCQLKLDIKVYDDQRNMSYMLYSIAQ